MRSVRVAIPFDGQVPAAAVAGVLEQLLGEHPGRGWVRIVVERDEPGRGPGTELKRLLRWFGISAKPNCPCLQHALEMDIAGPEWCAQNEELILQWLRQEAESRHLPFVEAAAKTLVRLAISRARRTA